MSNIEISKTLLTDIAKISNTRTKSKILKALGRREYDKCAEDVLYWLDPTKHGGIPYVYTLDPHPLSTCNLCGDGATHFFNKLEVHLKLKHGMVKIDSATIKSVFSKVDPVRAFILKPYMEPILRTWEKEPLFVIEKSRDVMATWMMVIAHTWDCCFHRGRQCIMQSKTSSDSNELIKRVKHIYDHQPKFLRDVVKGVYTIGTQRSGEFKLDDIKSEILGFPQGPDIIRQLHPSSVMVDEAAFQEKAADAFAAIKPAIQNGGRYTALSSANPGWFQHLCQDNLANF